MIEVRRVQSDEAEWLQTSFDAAFDSPRSAGHFAECVQLHQKGDIVLLIALDGDQYVGHCKIVWEPHYPYFRQNNIPEIQDLNVVEAYRRRGIASQMMDVAEAIIKERSTIAGIGFGMHPGYGPAQRMYIRRGYVPDGHGMAYHDEYVQHGDQVTVDDDLVLFLIREL